MNNVELEQYQGALPLEAGGFGICLPEDQTMAENLKQASEELKSHDFAFFNIMLSNVERDALKHVEISGFKNWGLFDDEILYLSEVAETFVRNFALKEADADNACIIAGLITRLVRVIIGEANHDSCKVMLRTYVHINNYTIDWHIDKTMEEIIGSSSNTTIRPTFIVPLHGEPTLFYPTNDQLRTDWNQFAEELSFTYGWLPVQHLISNTSLIVSAKPEQGSVHKAGQALGAIHASPNPEDLGRLLLLVLPDNRNAVLDLQAFEAWQV